MVVLYFIMLWVHTGVVRYLTHNLKGNGTIVWLYITRYISQKDMSKFNIPWPFQNTTKPELNHMHISSGLLSIMEATVALYLWHHNSWSKRLIHQPSEQHLGVLKIVVILNAILQIFYVTFTVYRSQNISSKWKDWCKGSVFTSYWIKHQVCCCTNHH